MKIRPHSAKKRQDLNNVRCKCNYVYTLLLFQASWFFVSVQPKFQFADICIMYIMLLFQSMMILLCRFVSIIYHFHICEAKSTRGTWFNKNSKKTHPIRDSHQVEWCERWCFGGEKWLLMKSWSCSLLRVVLHENNCFFLQ